MKGQYTATATITINATVGQVWEALTDPAIIKQYLFDTEVTTDWKKGSPIIYKGEWEGETYEDKGVIQYIEPHGKIAMTYWSPLSGTEDSPENYSTVTYELKSADNNNTVLTVSQDNNASQKEADRIENNWNSVLDSLKKLLEAQ